MKQNVGNTDKTLRITAGIAILTFGWFMKSWFALIGLVFIATAIIGVCPAYLPFGFSSNKSSSDKK